MKIGFVNDHFYPVIVGGLELFIKELSDYFAQEGFEIVVFTTEQNQKPQNKFPVYKIRSSPIHVPYFHGVPGLIYYQLPALTTPWMYFNFGLQKKLRQIYEKEKIDVLYIHTLRQVSFAPLQAAQDIPVVLHVHEYSPICFTRDFAYCYEHPDGKRGVFRCAYCMGQAILPAFPPLAALLAPALFPSLLIENHWRKKYLKLPAEIICDSNFVAQVLSTRGYKAKVIPTPYLGEIEDPDSIDRNQGKDDPFRLLFVGRLEGRKGADLVVDIAQKLRGKLDFRIDVVGTGYLLNRLDRKDLNIHVHGFLGKERFEFFRKADCLLALSRWPEPLGMIGQEAMAYQVPTIAFKDSGGLAELVHDNGAGLLAEDENDVLRCIMELYHNPTLRQDIRRNCMANIGRYDKKRIFTEFKEIFDKLQPDVIKGGEGQ